MSGHVTVPTWLAVLVVLLAAWALVDRLLMPSARWLLRSRANAVLDEVGRRLKIRIRPFQQVRRQALIDRLIFDDKVQLAMQAFADAKGMPREVALAQVQRYAREIVPAFNAFVYFRIGYWIAKRVSRALYRVRIGFTDDAGLEAIPDDATVVFVMNHRSNMDYVVASWLAAERAALSYAVGEWARVWGLQQLIRAMGAYFVRRDSKDELYRRVLERYIAMATEAGVTQAVFPEGGLTKDGRLGAPKLGLIDYMLKGFDEREGEERRDILFIPVGINYDRVLEDRTQLGRLDAQGPRVGRGRALATLVGFIGSNLWLMLRGRWYRFGYACVNFGSPVSMRRYVRERGVELAGLDEAARKEEVAALGRRLMQAIGAVIPVVPVALVAQVFRREPERALSELEIKSAACGLLREWEARGAHIYIPRHDQDYAIGVGLRMLTLRRIVVECDGLFVPVAENLPVLAYYANSVAHFGGEVARAVPVAETAIAPATS